jgi:RNA polymerase sigma-70 factor (ECF subfamily)
VDTDESVRFDTADGGPSPEQTLLQNTFSEDLQRALATLSEDQQLLIRLADIEGVPYQEIAQIMNRPVGTIRSRLHRTHKLLRSRLEQIRAEQQKPYKAQTDSITGSLRFAPSL